MKHPVQPIRLDKDGVARFKKNDLIIWLVANSGIDLNTIAKQGFSKSDQRQFAQLIGYSVSAYGELSYAAGHSSVEIADAAAAALLGVRGVS